MSAWTPCPIVFLRQSMQHLNPPIFIPISPLPPNYHPSCSTPTSYQFIHVLISYSNSPIFNMQPEFLIKPIHIGSRIMWPFKTNPPTHPIPPIQLYPNLSLPTISEHIYIPFSQKTSNSIKCSKKDITTAGGSSTTFSCFYVNAQELKFMLQFLHEPKSTNSKINLEQQSPFPNSILYTQGSPPQHTSGSIWSFKTRTLSTAMHDSFDEKNSNHVPNGKSHKLL